MQNKIYLSIDLDFWNHRERSFPHEFRFLTQVAKIAKTLDKGCFVMVDSHEELLPYVNKSGCNTLINVDFHSDLSNRFDSDKKQKYAVCGKREHLNCGNWVTYVDFKDTGEFIWIHPHSGKNIYSGFCHYPESNRHNPFVRPYLAGWENARKIRDSHPENIIDWKSVTHIGFSVSHDWTVDGRQFEIAEKVFGELPEQNPNAILF